MLRWFGRRRPAARPRQRFAELQAMPPAQRSAALAGPDRAGWLEAASRYGLLEAQLLLAQHLLDAGDAQQAFAWFGAAAASGNPAAVNMVGRCHERGWGVPSDPAEAARHYRRAAERGLDWAQDNLANLLLQGRGVPQDRGQAFALYRRAAGQGHAKSLNMLGRCYEEGWERLPDRGRAARCYAAAAAGGDFRGQFNLALMLAEQGRPEDACAWLARAFRQGSPDFLHDAVARLRASPDPALRAWAANFAA